MPQPWESDPVVSTEQKPPWASDPVVEQPKPSGTTLGQKLAIGAATGVRIAGGLVSAPAELLEAIPGPGTAAKAAVGATIGAGTDIAAQAIERAAGVRKSFSPAEVGVSAGLMAIPLGEFANIGRAARTGIRALQGAGLGAAGTQGVSLLETGKPASLKETAFGAGIGGAFGAGGEQVAQLIGRPSLAETVFGKREPPLASETAAEEVKQSAQKPDSETGQISTEQVQPTQQETTVQPQARDTRQTPPQVSQETVEQLPSPEAALDEAHGQLQSIYDQVKPVSTEGQAPVVAGQQTTEGGVSEEVQKEDEGQGRQGILTGQSPETVQPQTGAVPEKPITPTEIPVGGVSAAAMEGRPIEAPPPGTGVGWQETRAYGNKWLDSGGDINKVMSDFNRTGKLDEWEVGKGAAYLERLQSVTNRTADALRDNPSDSGLQKTYQDAVAKEQRFSEQFKPMATVASNQLKGFQGRVPLTDEMADSFTALTRKFGEINGREVTPEEVVKADRIAKQNAKVKGEYREANAELYRRADTEYGRIKTTRKGPPTLEDIGRTFGAVLKEVCDT